MYRFIRGGERSRHFPHRARARNPKPLVLAAFFGYFLSLVTESTPPEAIFAQGILPFTDSQQPNHLVPRKNPSTSLRLVPLPLGKGGNEFLGCGVRRGTWAPPYSRAFCRAGPVCPAVGAVQNRRADVGSELSAASGRSSEVSEWPRSKFPASAVRQRRNFGHRNRVIRNTPAQRSRRTDCHSQCAHWLRNDTLQEVW